MRDLVLAAFVSLGLTSLASAQSPEGQACVTLTSNLDVFGDVVICPGTYTLDDPEYDGVIRVRASNVTIDLTGVTLTGSQMQGFGIRADGYDGVTIRSGAIGGFQAAVYLSNGSGHSVEECDLSHNRKRPVTNTPADFLDVWSDLPGQFGGDQIGNGILLENISSSSIRRNRCSDQQNGIGLFQCTGIDVVQNNCDGNEGWGLHVHRSSHNVIARNSANDCFNKMSDYCHQQQQDGCDTAALLLIKDSNDNYVTGNSLRNGGDGVFSAAQEGDTHWGADRNQYIGNDCSFAKHIGLESTFSERNVFVRNIASNCGRYGFWLGYSRHPLVKNNQITGNAFAGISNESVLHEVVEGNEISFNNVGVELRRGGFGALSQDSRDHVFRHNQVHNNSDKGFSIVDTHEVTIFENTIQDNWGGDLSFGVALETDIQGPLAVNANNILGVGTLPFTVRNQQKTTVDLTDNWWGTVDPNAIAASIQGLNQYAIYPPHRIPRLSVTYMLGLEGPYVIERVVNERADDATDAVDTALGGRGNATGELRLGDGYCVGLRFRDVYLPASATILSASIVLPVDGPAGNPLDLVLTGEASDSAAPFEAGSEPLTRPRTLAQVAWAVTAPWSAASWENSADVTPLLAEILARPGWVSGNALALFADDAGTSQGWRPAWSFDREGYTDIPGTPYEFRHYRKFRFSKLEIEYDLAGARMVVEREHSTGADDADDCVGCNEVHFGIHPFSVTAGFRFASVALPKTGAVTASHVWLPTDGTYTNVIQVHAYGELLDDAPAYSDFDIPLNRPKTVASFPWTISNQWDFLDWHATPDLSALLGEIVAQPGWAQGNALAFDFADEGSIDHRRVWAFERDPRASPHDFDEVGATPFVPFRNAPVDW